MTPTLLYMGFLGKTLLIEILQASRAMMFLIPGSFMNNAFQPIGLLRAFRSGVFRISRSPNR